MTMAISVENLTFRYTDGQEALKDVNLTVRTGETVGLIGRNGAGKTTLAKHFNSLLKATSGKVIVNEIDTSSRSTSQMARMVGYVFQNPEDQLFGSSALEEVTFGPMNLGFSQEQIDRSVNEALTLVGLSSTAHEHPYSMNYGQRKMLCLASVLAMDPSILIMDEPTAGQDCGGLILLGSIVDRLKAEGKTIVMISHDMEFTARYCDRIALMNEGRIFACDATRNILSDLSKLAPCGIRSPQVARLANLLSSDGVRPDIITVDEMVQELLGKRIP